MLEANRTKISKDKFKAYKENIKPKNLLNLLSTTTDINITSVNNNVCLFTTVVAVHLFHGCLIVGCPAVGSWLSVTRKSTEKKLLQ